MMVEDIPKGWRKGKLSELVHFPESGGRPKGGASSETGKIPSIGAEFITRDGRLHYDGMKFIPEDYFINMNSGKLHDGDILICKDGALTGKVAFYENSPYDEAVVNEHVFILRPLNGDCRKFIFYSLQSDAGQNKVRKIMTGSAQPGINTTFPRYYDLLIPTKKEQEKIAEILSTIDENIFETERIVNECERIKKGLMQTLLLKGILGKHKKFKNTELGEIPEEWEIKDMKDLGSFDKGKGISKKELIEIGIPCVRYGEIYTSHHFKIKKFFSFIDKDTSAESTLILKGDILLAGSGETLEDIGKSVVYLGKEEAYAGGDTIIFRPKKQNSLYLCYVLNSGVIREQINRLGQGHSVVHLYPRQLMNVQIPIPPIEEQDEIANILDELDYKIDIEKEKRNAILKLKLSLMQKLLSGEIRVMVNKNGS